MKRGTRLETLSNDRLLEELSSLVGRGNKITAELLAYLAEVDHRKLYLREACPSLFEFCTRRLHLSEGAAAKRIRAARAARQFPVLFELIAKGEIHLAGISLLASHLTEENHRELLARAKHRTKREIERLVAELAPKPDEPSSIRKLPAPRPAPPSAQSESPRPGATLCSIDAHDQAADSQPALPASSSLTRPKPAEVAPLSPGRYKLTVTLDEKTHTVLEELQDLLAHQIPSRDPAEIVTRALDLLRAKTLARKAALTQRPREPRTIAKPSHTCPEPRQRAVPAWIRREVWKRDGGRCTFVDHKGRRCSARHALEYHHLIPWALGGEHSLEVITLRCRAHNQYQAELDFGAAFMAKKRGEQRPAQTPRG